MITPPAEEAKLAWKGFRKMITMFTKLDTDMKAQRPVGINLRHVIAVWPRDSNTAWITLTTGTTVCICDTAQAIIDRINASE